MKKLLLGNEALAQGAIDAGISGVYAYPGTPSTEITEYIQQSKIATELKIHSKWSVNEKTAMEAALGMSYAGKRAMTVMKHVGLNVAADVFMNMAISGINGGLVVVVADDPSMHSSQNEQDSRNYGRFAMIPILEPSNQQEAYDITRYAFYLSEQIGLPIMIRMVTRLSHSRAGIETYKPKPQNTIHLPKNPHQFQLIPIHARNRYQHLVAIQSDSRESSENSNFNKYISGPNNSLGIIASGIAYNYLMENFDDDTCPFPILKIGQYPLPKKQVTKLFDTCKKILVLEDGAPFIEELVHDYFGRNKKVMGRLTGHLNRVGELNPDNISDALGFEMTYPEDIPTIVTDRPPELCVGCAHRDLFEAINQLSKEHSNQQVFGDIGCYALGVLPPYKSINTLIDMGASITMAKGASDAGIHPSIAIIGDSTFTHSGMTGLLDAVIENTPITVIISDNSAIAMTGAQDSSASGRLISICKGIGVDENHLKVITPLHKNLAKNIDVIREEINYPGVSVVIAQRPCVQLPKERKDALKELQKTL
ncbi:indolepyruvate ferredoxin oxidoreductase alpha subunit [Lutibacter agarilyticus]|uniref:Indolepyruvate oxidoreductase subunit IorA n=1 Tax=Lutibacter agarilyticus TaxID=1109740 RepID=A0A238X2Q3_9FLAO|nr:thiamine pyrophosphate-dependent enzyme [Lutibacter agarilyticus]SNR52848.1 indolepyruvate ferredoxin oxidoreductase alpha subunit [Lutibacter agarilyticus]